jgi:putative Holliday junction resolvase
MKLLGIDYGKKKMGLAIGDTDLKIALPLEIVYLKKISNIFQYLSEIIEKEKIDKVILGLPLSLKEEETEMSLIVKEFYNKLKEKINIPIEFESEVLTTQQAVFDYQALTQRRKKPIKEKPRKFDSYSATIILEKYLTRMGN